MEMYSNQYNAILNNGFYPQFIHPMHCQKRNISPHLNVSRNTSTSPFRNSTLNYNYPNFNHQRVNSGNYYNLYNRNGSLPNSSYPQTNQPNSMANNNQNNSKSANKVIQSQTSFQSFNTPSTGTPSNTPRGRIESANSINQSSNSNKQYVPIKKFQNGSRNEEDFDEFFTFTVKFAGKFKEDIIFLREILLALPKDIEPEFLESKHKMKFRVNKSECKANPLLSSLLHKVEKTGKKAVKGVLLSLAPSKSAKLEKENNERKIEKFENFFKKEKFNKIEKPCKEILFENIQFSCEKPILTFSSQKDEKTPTYNYQSQNNFKVESVKTSNFEQISKNSEKNIENSRISQQSQHYSQAEGAVTGYLESIYSNFF